VSPTKYGKLVVHSCGFVGSVCSALLFCGSAADELCFNSWFREERSLVCHFSTGTEVTKLILSRSSTIIEDLEDLRRAGLASLAYYYFDFKDSGKQDRRGLLASLLVQLSARSDASCEILNRLYSDHENGSRQPREDRLIQCLKEVLAAQKGEVYVIIDAVDECPNNYGMPTSREMVLELLNELASLQFSHVHFCITSRPEVDIRIILEPLTSHIISLHDEGGQRKDILDYINSVIESDLNTRRWREEDKQLVINALAQKADGM
jgi:hypothetical protein